MTYADLDRQRRFLDWHVRTDHEWDMRLHAEAFSLRMWATMADLGEALLPGLQRLVDNLRAILPPPEPRPWWRRLADRVA